MRLEGFFIKKSGATGHGKSSVRTVTVPWHIGFWTESEFKMENMFVC